MIYMLFLNKPEKAIKKVLRIQKKGYTKPLSEVSITKTVVEKSK